MSSIVGFWVVIVMLLASFAPPSDTIVAVPERHFSIEVPSNWTYDRNISHGDVFFDVFMYGPPNSDNTNPFFGLGTWMWSGIVSDEALYQTQIVQLNGLRSVPGLSNFSFSSPPSNITIDGEKANRCNVSFQAEGQQYIMSGLVVACDDWNLTYYLAFYDGYSDWVVGSLTCSQIIDSFHIEKKEEPVSSLTVVLLSVAVITAAMIVVLLLLRRRRRLVQMTAPHLQGPVGEFFREPGVIGPGNPRQPGGPPGEMGGPVS